MAVPKQPLLPPEPVFSPSHSDKTSSPIPAPSQGQERMLRSDYAPVRIAFAKTDSEKLELSKKFISQLQGYQSQLSKLQIPHDEASAANFSSLNSAFSQTVQKAEHLISLLESGKLKGEDAQSAFALLETLLSGAKISLFMSLDSLAPKSDTIGEKVSVLDMEDPGERKKVYEDTYSGFFNRITHQTFKSKDGQTKSRGYIEQGFISEFFKWKADFLYQNTCAFYEQHKALCNPRAFDSVQQAYKNAMEAAALPGKRGAYSWVQKNYDALKSLAEECETFSLKLSIEVQREQNKTKVTPVFGGLLKMRESTRENMLAWNSAAQTLCALGIGMTGGPAGKAFEKLYFSYHAGSQIAQGDEFGGAIFLTALWAGPLAGTLQGLSKGTQAAAKFLSFAGSSAGIYMLGSMAHGTAVTLNDIEKFGFSHEAASMLVENGVFATVGMRSGKEASKTPLARALRADRKAQNAGWSAPEKRAAHLFDAAEQYLLAGNETEAKSSYHSALGSLSEAVERQLLALYEDALSSSIKDGRLDLFQEIYTKGYEQLRLQYGLPQNVFEVTPELAALYKRAVSVQPKSSEPGVDNFEIFNLQSEFSGGGAYKSIRHCHSVSERAISILELAADAYLQQGKPGEAASLLLDAGYKSNSERRLQLYEKAEKMQLQHLEFGMLEETYGRMASDYGQADRTGFFRLKISELESLGQSLYGQKNYEKAAEALELAIELRRRHGPSPDAATYEFAAEALFMAGRFDKAYAFYTGAAESFQYSDPPRALAIYEKAGSNFHSAGAHSEAGYIFNRAADLLNKTDKPRAAELYEKAGNSWLNAEGQAAAAANSFSKAAELLKGADKPRAAELYERAGRIFSQAGSHESAAESLVHACDILEKMPAPSGQEQQAHANLVLLLTLAGDSYAKASRFEDASSKYRRAADMLVYKLSDYGGAREFMLSKAKYLEQLGDSIKDESRPLLMAQAYTASVAAMEHYSSTPATVELLTKCALALALARDFEPAAAQFVKAAERLPQAEREAFILSKSQYLEQLGDQDTKASFQAGYYRAAKTLLEQNAELIPNKAAPDVFELRANENESAYYSSLLLKQADAEARAHQFSQACTTYQSAARLMPQAESEGFLLSKSQYLEQLGDSIQNAQLASRRAQAYKSAAELVEKTNPEKASGQYEKAGDHSSHPSESSKLYLESRILTQNNARKLALADKEAHARIKDRDMAGASDCFRACAEFAGSSSESASYISKASLAARIGNWITDAKSNPAAGQFLQNYKHPWLLEKNITQIGEFMDAGFHPEVAFALLECKTDWGAQQIKSLRTLLPPGGEASKDKYTRSNLISFMQTNPVLQAKILEYCLQKQPSKALDMDLLSLMSLANSLGEKFVETLALEQFVSMSDAHNRGRNVAIDLLSSNTSREALQNVPTEHLARWLSVFPEFEQTMRVHNDENLIPPLRLLSTIELLGEQERFSQHSPELAAYLKENAQTLFPQEAERTAILEYIGKWESMEPEKAIMMTADAEAVRTTLAKWNAPISVDHVLEEVSAIDRAESVRTHLDAVFHKGHFSDYFLHAASLAEGAERLGKTLAEEYRTKKAAGAPDAELARIRQRQASPEVSLQSMFLNYESKFDALQGKIQQAGAAIAPYADLLGEWGFDYGDSFGNKVFRGELTLLSKRCNEELKKAPKNERLQALAREIGSLEDACKKLDDYLITVADDLSPAKQGRQGILSYLREKQQWSHTLHSDFKAGKLSFKQTLAKIEAEQPEFFRLLKAELDKEEIPAQKDELLKTALLQYTEQTAIIDLETIVPMVRGTSADAGKSLRYVAQDNFSLMELATVGQCLDYRYSKNSIGNAPFTVSYLDSWRQMVVAYPAEDAKMEHPRVDGLIFLSNVSEGNSPARPSIVMDRIYTPDGTSMSWAKIEGQIKFALARSEATGMPAIIPEHLSTYFKQVEELASFYGYTAREASVKVPLFVGPAGQTYCELTGYVHYDSNTTLAINALILEKSK